jgi:hypothetical protein
MGNFRQDGYEKLGIWFELKRLIEPNLAAIKMGA